MTENGNISTDLLINNYRQEAKTTIAAIDITICTLGRLTAESKEAEIGLEDKIFPKHLSESAELVIASLKAQREVNKAVLDASPKAIEKFVTDLMNERQRHLEHSSENRTCSVETLTRYDMAKEEIAIDRLKFAKFCKENSIERSLKEGKPIKIMWFSERNDFNEKLAKGEIKERDLNSFIKETEKEIEVIKQLIKECEFAIIDHEDTLKYLPDSFKDK
ncbi:MAG: hypothetical protein KAS78_02065 [Candidatus Pacebacteria bacterium]|nr:hypothetical protein [Candidatus Paceibacterota bacterium]